MVRAMDHADRFCKVLSRLHAPRGDVTRLAWLLGRRQEIASFVEQISRQYRCHKLEEAAAIACLDAYLVMLHASLASLFGDRSPACCGQLAVTVVSPRPADGTPTRVYVPVPIPKAPPRPAPRPPAPTVRRPRLEEEALTWVDPDTDDLLAGIVTRNR
jgi:hypothetical protein